MRLAIGGIWHETNTFAPGQTSTEAFLSYQFAEGSQLLETYANTGTELGGALRAALEEGIDVVPLSYRAAVPSGIVAESALDDWIRVTERLVSGAGAIDAVLLSLHGAMVVEHHPDAELDIVRALQRMTGDVPIAVTLDLHGNPSATLGQSADLIVGYNTYPHSDMAERGAEAVRLLTRILRDGSNPDTWLTKLPLVTVPQVQETEVEPMRSIFSRLSIVERDERIWTASVFPGFAYSDVARLGVSVYVAADQDARTRAEEIAAHIWSLREELIPTLVEPSEIVRRLDELEGPVVLVDVADNVGGGSPGDGSVLLALLEERSGRDGIVVIWDPECVREAYTSKQSNIEVRCGGRGRQDMGVPVVLKGRVERLGNVTYSRRGSYMKGQQVNMGRVAVLRSAAGSVVVTEKRVMPFDSDHLTVLGLEPKACHVIVTKSAIAWKAAFGDIARNVFYVDTPGYCPSDVAKLAYRHRPAPLFPLDEQVAWP